MELTCVSFCHGFENKLHDRCTAATSWRRVPLCDCDVPIPERGRVFQDDYPAPAHAALVDPGLGYFSTLCAFAHAASDSRLVINVHSSASCCFH